MFNNPGKKLKVVAKVFFWILVVIFTLSSVFFAFSYAYRDVSSILLAIIVAIVGIALGVLFAWLACLTTYGLGQLIDSTQQIEKKINELSD